MKVMISQPMAGKTEEEIRKERENVVKLLEEKGYEVVDSIFSDNSDKTYKDVPLHHLAKSIDLMGKVDIVAFMGDWVKARGCNVEHTVANLYDKHIMYITRTGQMILVN